MGLTDAVLSRTKTQTRRLVSEKLWDAWTEYDDFCHVCAHPAFPPLANTTMRRSSFLTIPPIRLGKSWRSLNLMRMQELTLSPAKMMSLAAMTSRPIRHTVE